VQCSAVQCSEGQCSVVQWPGHLVHLGRNAQLVLQYNAVQCHQWISFFGDGNCPLQYNAVLQCNTSATVYNAVRGRVELLCRITASQRIGMLPAGDQLESRSTQMMAIKGSNDDGMIR
jgi:hypothetical protein